LNELLGVAVAVDAPRPVVRNEHIHWLCSTACGAPPRASVRTQHVNTPSQSHALPLTPTPTRWQQAAVDTVR
jgi:hypothetical protein